MNETCKHCGFVTDSGSSATGHFLNCPTLGNSSRHLPAQKMNLDELGKAMELLKEAACEQNKAANMLVNCDYTLHKALELFEKAIGNAGGEGGIRTHDQSNNIK